MVNVFFYYFVEMRSFRCKQNVTSNISDIVWRHLIVAQVYSCLMACLLFLFFFFHEKKSEINKFYSFKFAIIEKNKTRSGFFWLFASKWTLLYFYTPLLFLSPLIFKWIDFLKNWHIFLFLTYELTLLLLSPPPLFSHQCTKSNENCNPCG